MARFWSGICAIIVVGMMVLSGLFVVMPQTAQAAGGRDSLGYVRYYTSNVTTVAAGDKGLRAYVGVQDIKPDFPYNLYNVTIEVMGVQDNPLNPFIWNVPKTKEMVNLSYNGDYDYWTGIEFEVQDAVTPGRYNVTLYVQYQYRVQNDNRFWPGEDSVIWPIEIRSIMSIGNRISHFDEYGSTINTLFAGESFQKMGVYAPTSSMYSSRTVVGGKVQATLVDKSGADYSGFTWKEKVATIQDVTTYHYFYYRLTVDASKKAGIYEYSLELKYTRKDSYTNNEQITVKEMVPLSMFVDFTPLLEIYSGGEQTVTQGLTQFQFSVVLRNGGNCDLAKLKVSLDISAYFQYHSGSYYTGDGYRTYAGTETYIESLPKGTQVSVEFVVDVYKYVPAGQHRLPFQYTGYFYDDGSYTYSDWKATSDYNYQLIKGDTLYVKVNVLDPSVEVSAESSGSFSLAHQLRDVTIPVKLTNKEAVQYDDVVLKLACFPRTNPLAAIFVNPDSPGSRTLDDVSLLNLPSSSTEYAYFHGDLSPNARPGSQQVELNFTATDHNTGVQVTKLLIINVRVTPGPPAMELSTSYEPLFVKPGKSFLLEVRMQNTGQDTARDVSVALLIPSGRSSGFIVNGDNADAYSIEGMLNPFSVAMSRLTAANVDAGGFLSKNFTVSVDRNIAKGKAYPMTVEVTYLDADGVPHNASTDISVTATGSPPVKAAAPDPLAVPLTLGIVLVVLIWVLFVIGAIIIRRMGGPKAAREAPAAATTSIPPPASPPPQAFTSAPPQYFPPPPPPPEQAQPQAPQPGGPRACRKCGMTVTPGNYMCPNCGTPV